MFPTQCLLITWRQRVITTSCMVINSIKSQKGLHCSKAKMPTLQHLWMMCQLMKIISMETGSLQTAQLEMEQRWFTWFLTKIHKKGERRGQLEILDHGTQQDLSSSECTDASMRVVCHHHHQPSLLEDLWISTSGPMPVHGLSWA